MGATSGIGAMRKPDATYTWYRGNCDYDSIFLYTGPWWMAYHIAMDELEYYDGRP